MNREPRPVVRFAAMIAVVAHFLLELICKLLGLLVFFFCSCVGDNESQASIDLLEN